MVATGCNDVSAMIMYRTHSNDHLNFDNDVATTNEYSLVLHKSNSIGYRKYYDQKNSAHVGNA